MNTKTIALGSLCAAIAAMFQLTPIFFSEVLVFLTIFSTLPIYIISRIDPKAGVLSYFAASILIMFLSIHEGLFFLLTNGFIGITLGIFSRYTNSKMITLIFSSLFLTITLSILNYGIGIPIFGAQIPGTFIVQITVIFLFSAVYDSVYYYFANLIYNHLVKRHILH